MALLSGSDDPVAALAAVRVGVATPVDSVPDAERFGEIPTTGYDEGGQKIITGLSTAVANLSDPRSVHAAAQAGVGQIRAVEVAAALI
jgi:hypothetical protein